MGLFDFIRKKTLADQTDQEPLAREKRRQQTNLIGRFVVSLSSDRKSPAVNDSTHSALSVRTKQTPRACTLPSSHKYSRQQYHQPFSAFARWAFKN